MQRLERHHGDLLRLTGRAERELAAGRPEAAAAWAQIAGQFAWTNHSGVFASPRLEALLFRLSATIATVTRAAPPRQDPRSVLHVLTQAYATGGSTREVECWAQQDTARTHRVAVTRQGPSELPASLVEALGTDAIARLDAGPGGLLRRAARLRRLSAEADVVVLHVHPYDVAPVLAFGEGSGAPPVVMVNQADHVFWLGTSVSDAVLHMRESGREVAERRRGIEPERSVICARPLAPRERAESRAEAKRRLGVPEDAVLLVTAAAATKYRPIGGPGFLDLVIPVLERNPGAQLVAAGPAPEGDWAEASERTGGRIRALGRLNDIASLHEAADVYVDSFPFSSLTSLLEAGCLGTPAVTFRGHPDECAVLGGDVPGVDEHIHRPADPAAFAAVLDRLISDADWRLESGERTRLAIAATHLGDGWRADVSAVYARAAAFAAGALPRDRLARLRPARPARRPGDGAHGLQQRRRRRRARAPRPAAAAPAGGGHAAACGRRRRAARAAPGAGVGPVAAGRLAAPRPCPREAHVIALGVTVESGDSREVAMAVALLREAGIEVSERAAVICLLAAGPLDQRLARIASALEERPERLVVARLPGDAAGGGLRRALRAGAQGLVLDDELADTLVPTVRAVLAGQLVMPPALRRHLAPDALSHREKQVIGLAAAGARTARSPPSCTSPRARSRPTSPPPSASSRRAPAPRRPR